MTASNFIPKDKLTAYQRWEMESLDPLAAKHQSLATREEFTPPEEPIVQVSLPTADEVAAILQHAREEGYAEGYQAGNTAGYTEGKQQAEAEINVEVVHLKEVLSQLQHDLATLDQAVANDLLELAITLSKKMIGQAFQVKPELILPIVQEAVLSLPQTQQAIRVYLHPEDAKLVQLHLAEPITQDNWSIREDAQLLRGGCRIENSGGEVDASLTMRWQRVLSTLGQTHDWFDNPL